VGRLRDTSSLRSLHVAARRHHAGDAPPDGGRARRRFPRFRGSRRSRNACATRTCASRLIHDRSVPDRRRTGSDGPEDDPVVFGDRWGAMTSRSNPVPPGRRATAVERMAGRGAGSASPNWPGAGLLIRIAFIALTLVLRPSAPGSKGRPRTVLAACPLHAVPAARGGPLVGQAGAIFRSSDPGPRVRAMFSP